jgi:hypothetical protein
MIIGDKYYDRNVEEFDEVYQINKDTPLGNMFKSVTVHYKRK